MLNELLTQLRRYDMVKPGDVVTCAVSGGADSVALLFAMYLLKEKLGITLRAAHFNHHLRAGESDRDAAFVRDFCGSYGIPLELGEGSVIAGEKGLEAAARDARYVFLMAQPGLIATAHTADDNAETLLMHLVRGTGLKGLGAISPVRGRLIRPMLTVTREQVMAFLEEYHLPHVEDSSNASDDFLRNRLRHHVMPLLRQENPQLAKNLSAMAMRLREDERTLSEIAEGCFEVEALRQMPPAQRSRVLARFLERSGVKEPEREHIDLAERLVFSEKPSARAQFPGGVTVRRCYGRLTAGPEGEKLEPTPVSCPGTVVIPNLGLRVTCEAAEDTQNTPRSFTVSPEGPIALRARQPGDTIRLSGGSKSLKKLFIDRKIPAAQRLSVPVIADDRGVLGVYGIGANLDRLGPGVRIGFEEEQSGDSLYRNRNANNGGFDNGK